MSEPKFNKSSTHKPKAKIGQAGSSHSVKEVDYQKVNINMNKKLKGLCDMYISHGRNDVDGLNMSKLLSMAVRDYMKRNPMNQEPE